MTKFTDIIVGGTMENVQGMLGTVFAQNGFTVTWQTPFSGKAEKGSKGMNIAFGAFAQHYEMDFQVMKAQDASIVVRLFKTNSGWWGGVIGASRVETKYQEVINFLCYYFQQQGVLLGRS